jgi:hypothetical protein
MSRRVHEVDASAMRKPLRLAAAVVGAALAAAAAAPAAHAGLLGPTDSGCQPAQSAREFLPWLDVARYVPVADGGLEAGGRGWTLDGASVEAANEPWRVGDRSDSRAVALPAGSAATTPAMCVGLEHPTVRFFARGTGLLAVEVLADSALDRVVLPIGVVSGIGGGWAPSLPMALVANALTLLPGDVTRVSFRFAPVGSGSSFEVDDVYVDPYSKR